MGIAITVEITGHLPITPLDAEVLEYMTNVGGRSYRDLLGSKFPEEVYTSLLERILKAAREVLDLKARLDKAADPHTVISKRRT